MFNALNQFVRWFEGEDDDGHTRIYNLIYIYIY